MRAGVVVAAICLSVVGLSKADPARAAIARETHIPAEALGPALRTFAEDYDFQVLYRTEVVGNLRTSGASGRMSASEALERVLTGTGLTYKFVDDNTVTVVPVSHALDSTTWVQDAPGATAQLTRGAPGEARDGSTSSVVVAQADHEGPAGSVVAATVTGPAAEESSAQALEEIIVTATKRGVRLQDAPMSIDTIQGDRLQQLGISSFAEFAQLVPSVNVAGSAAPGVGTVIIRGLYSGNFQVSTTTATYIGETPFTANAALSLSGLINPDPDLLDVERIEVLKGPQGTLYGASSLGGLIRIIPKEPDASKFSSDVRLDASAMPDGGSGAGGRVSANVPLSDRSALRVSGFYKYDPGFTTNLGTGNDDLGNTRTEGGTAALKVDVSDRWEAKLSGFYQHSETHGFQWQSNLPGTGTPVYGERTYSYAYDGSVDSQLSLVEGTTNYRFDAGTLTATLSWGSYDVDIYRDFTQIYGFVNAFFVPPGLLPDDTTVYGHTGPTADKTTAEIRFASARLGDFEYLGGLFYTDEDTEYPVSMRNESPPGQPITTPGYEYIGNINSLNSYKEYAGFGDVTYYVTDDVDLTGGLRYSHNKQDIRVVVVEPGILPLPPSHDEFSSSSTLYQFSARWRPSKELSLYLRAASGYRPGGTQTLIGGADVPRTYTPDKTYTYEAGLKGQLADRGLSFELALHHTDWKDIHLTALKGGVGYVLNGGDAKVDGVEAQLDWDSLAGFRAGVAAGYNNARLSRVSADSAASIGAEEGDRLPGAPRVSAAAYAEYHHALSDQVDGRVGATLTYQGDKVSSYPGNTSDVNYAIPSYALLDLRTGLSWGSYTLDFRVSNVTNRNGVTGSYVQAAIPGTVPQDTYLTRPRTFAVSFSARL